MTTKLLALISVIGLASTCLVQGQSPTPGESPAASPSTAESPAASPSPKKPRSRKKAEAAAAASPATESTAAASASPAEKRSRKKARTETAASPAAASPAPATPAAATNATPAPGGGHGLVWVNTDTHIYHKEGSRFYGKTKNGKYVSEADAIKEGDRAAAKEY